MQRPEKALYLLPIILPLFMIIRTSHKSKIARQMPKGI